MNNRIKAHNFGTVNGVLSNCQYLTRKLWKNRVFDFRLFFQYLNCWKISGLLFVKKLAISGLFFFIFVFSIQLPINVQYKKCLPMTGFEPRPSRVESNRSTNLPTTTLPTCFFIKRLFSSLSQLEKFFLKINFFYFQFSASQFTWQIWQTNNSIESNKSNRIMNKA